MTANEDPAAQYDAEAAGAGRPGDELEDWLSDLRTEGTADPSGWVDPAGWAEQEAEQPSRGGRHRAPE